MKWIQDVGFDAVATIVDGHSSNTKFYHRLCENAIMIEQCSKENEEENPDDLEKEKGKPIMKHKQQQRKERRAWKNHSRLTKRKQRK